MTTELSDALHATNELSARLQPAPNLQWKKFKSSIVIEPGLVLNDSAAFAFGLLDGQTDLQRVCELLAAEYRISVSDVVDDVLELSRELLKHKIVIRQLEAERHN
ncbi:MAG: PqqD family protein [Rhizomicrobium sp.]